MKVIFVGFFKTGTKTMNEALRILGYRVSDIARNFSELHDDWWKFFDGKETPGALPGMFKDYDATGDAPAFMYWRDFLKAFPDIKIILTTREEDGWLRSWNKQVKEVNESHLAFPLSVFSKKARKWHDFANASVIAALKQPSPKFSIVRKYPMYEDDVCRKAFKEHNEEILKEAPRGQLLVYNVKEGWDPLCRFLGHKVPDVRFPHLNKGGKIIAWRLKNNTYMLDMYREMYINLALIVLLLSFILIYVYCC